MKDYIIRTGRLGMRNWEESDLEPFTRQNLDEEVMRYFPTTYSAEKTAASVKRYREHIDEHGFGMFATDYLDDNRFIGFIGIAWLNYETDFTPAVEIGWRLNKEYWGKGLATEGAKACLDYAFKQLNLDKICSMTVLGNTPSERVMQKIGMRKTGTFLHPKVPAGHPMQEHVLYWIYSPLSSLDA